MGVDYGERVSRSLNLPFDPIERAAQLWSRRWGPSPAMAAVTSIMRAQQILLAELDGVLKPYGLTFARYEALVLLTFSREGALPLRKMGERLMVHPTSVTNTIDRLETQGLVGAGRTPRTGAARWPPLPIADATSWRRPPPTSWPPTSGRAPSMSVS